MEDRDALREAGFTFDRLHTRKWRTKDWRKAAILIDYLDDVAWPVVRSMLDDHEAALNASYAMHADADIPRPHLVNHKGEVLDYLPYQKAGILYANEREDCLIADSPGLGKGQPLWAKVLTPSGWCLIGNLSVGDPIIGSDGKTYAVTGVYDKGILPVYRVEFNDGAVTHVDPEHLWQVRRRKESQGAALDWEVIDTSDIISRAYPAGLSSNRIEIPLFNDGEELSYSLPIDPYVVGALLGDGGLTQTGHYFYNIDTDIVESVRTRLPQNVVLNHSAGCAYRIVGKCGKRTRPAIMTTLLCSLEMDRVRAENKTVPTTYMHAPKLARMQVLRGLMDTDGCVTGGRVRFSSSSEKLRDDVVALVQSLGGIATKSHHLAVNGKPHFVAAIKTTFNPFGYCQHKLTKWKPSVKYKPKRMFKSIDLVGSEQVRCISVSAPDKLYITDDYIVTHNTIQAIGLINYENITSGLIVCPSSLKLNWKKEMEKWLVDKTLTVGVAYGNDIPDTDFVIINYDILHRNVEVLWDEHWGILVCDEAQMLSNGKSNRTKAVFGQWYWDKRLKREVRKKWRDSKGKGWPGMIRANKRVMLSGTPMTKRPIDMWPMIRDFDPNGLGKSYDYFAYQYCDAFENGFALDVSGGSNLEELNELLRKGFMIRRLKSNVLKDLPEKTREVIILPPEGLKKLIKTERDKFTDSLAMLDAVNTGIEYKPKMALEEVDPGLMLDTMTTILRGDFDKEALGELTAGEIEPGFAVYSEARHNLALSKVPMACEHIKRLVDAGEKVLVFAIHTDVVKAIREQFPTAARIVGGMTPKKVEAEKLRFQGDKDLAIEPDPECNVLIANIKAGGTGHTLTEATVVVFVEIWSVPGDMEQCEDRAHRIGLEHNVLIQFLVVDGTMDAATINTLITRIAMIQRAVDGVANDNGQAKKEAA